MHGATSRSRPASPRGPPTVSPSVESTEVSRDEGEGTPSSWVVSEQSTDSVRCEASLSGGEHIVSGLLDFEQSVRPVALDLCAGTVTEVHRQGTCADARLELKVRPLTPVR